MWYKSVVTDAEEPTTSLAKTLQHCDKLLYPNVHRLLSLLATTPVTSCEAERTFSQMKLVKNVLRSAMSTDRLNSLLTLRIHYNYDIDCSSIVNTVFAAK